MTPEEIDAVLSRAQEQPSWDPHHRTQLDEVIAAFEDRYLLATHVKAQDAQIERLRIKLASVTRLLYEPLNHDILRAALSGRRR